MPRLLTFAPCERAVKDAKQGNASLFTILEEITISLPRGIELPSNAVAPMGWSIFSLWEREVVGESESFEIMYRIVGPDNQELLKSDVFPVNMGEKPRMHVISSVQHFPIGVAGRCELRLFVRATGATEFEQKATFPIQLIHATVEGPRPETVS